MKARKHETNRWTIVCLILIFIINKLWWYYYNNWLFDFMCRDKNGQNRAGVYDVTNKVKFHHFFHVFNFYIACNFWNCWTKYIITIKNSKAFMIGFEKPRNCNHFIIAPTNMYFLLNNPSLAGGTHTYACTNKWDQVFALATWALIHLALINLKH